MDTEFSIGLGILMKLYDEITDLQIQVSDTSIELIKVMIIGCFTLLSIHDFNFSCLVSIAFLGNYFVGGVDTPFWKSFAILSLVLSILSYQTMNLTKKFVLFGFLFLVAIIVEPCLFPEETSFLKTCIRFLACVCILLLKQTSLLNDLPVYNKIATFILSYFGTSILFTSFYIPT